MRAASGHATASAPSDATRRQRSSGRYPSPAKLVRITSATDSERTRTELSADAVPQVGDAVGGFLDVRGGQHADQVEFDVFGGQVVVQAPALPEQHRHVMQFQLVELRGPQ